MSGNILDMRVKDRIFESYSRMWLVLVLSFWGTAGAVVIDLAIDLVGTLL